VKVERQLDKDLTEDAVCGLVILTSTLHFPRDSKKEAQQGVQNELNALKVYAVIALRGSRRYYSILLLFNVINCTI
jgi:hypothetical protein